jgi:hypothetical protein
MKTAPDQIRELRLTYALIANDAWAASFQTIGQYRRALLKSMVTMIRQYREFDES